ncbi:MAG: hypothetical protein ABSA02_20650 [Trebonia sp.]|jgi:hypothetical protein
MGWCTTSDLDQFAAAAGGYLRSRAAENTMLLSAALAVRSGWHAQVVGQPSGPGAAAGGAGGPSGMLYGWWEPPDGSGARGAFVHDPAAPLLIAGRAPEMAAALAGTLSKLGRHVSGVDAPVEAADAFAAAWSQRERSSVRVHRQCRVYRLTAANASANASASGGGPGGWPPPQTPSPAGRLRVMTHADRALLIDWLAAFGLEAGERIGSPADVADDLLSYGGAVLWEVPQRNFRIREAAHYLVSPQHREAAQQAEPAYQPAAMAAVARPVAGTARINMVYTPPERRRNGHAAAVTLMTSRAILAGAVPGYVAVAAEATAETTSEVVLIADGNRPDRRITRLGYQLVGERTVLRFGPATGPQPRLQSATRPMPRLPTGPLPRLRR